MEAQEDPDYRRAAERVGQVVHGKYTLHRLLGVGGMAAVYAAEHRNGQKVAVKMLHPELSRDKAVRGRFLREGYVANAVKHPCAVSVIDDDVTADGAVFLVMELLEGETLDARWVRKGHMLPAGEVLSVADQLLGALAAAHQNGIVHRDIKPENLFIQTNGALKILDFGIARLHEPSPAAKVARTKTGTMMGSPAFMPPEQALGKTGDIDARTDLWAVGATMFTLLTGRYVHEGQTANAVLLKAMTVAAPSLAAVRPDCHRALVAVVDHALAFKQNDRWSDALAMRHSVREAFQALQRTHSADALRANSHAVSTPPWPASPSPVSPIAARPKQAFDSSDADDDDVKTRLLPAVRRPTEAEAEAEAEDQVRTLPFQPKMLMSSSANKTIQVDDDAIEYLERELPRFRTSVVPPPPELLTAQWSDQPGVGVRSFVSAVSTIVPALRTSRARMAAGALSLVGIVGVLLALVWSTTSPTPAALTALPSGSVGQPTTSAVEPSNTVSSPDTPSVPLASSSAPSVNPDSLPPASAASAPSNRSSTKRKPTVTTHSHGSKRTNGYDRQ